MLPSVVPSLATDGSESVSWCFETSLFFKTPFLGWSSIPTSFVSLFIFLYFCLPPFEDNGLLFWVPVANIRWIMEKRREFQKNIRYVDDTTLMEESEEEIKSLLMKV